MLLTRSFNLKVKAGRQYEVLDSDLEIKGGKGRSPKKIFQPFGPQFGKRIGGGGGPPLYPPLIWRIQFENKKVKKMKMTPGN